VGTLGFICGGCGAEFTADYGDCIDLVKSFSQTSESQGMMRAINYERNNNNRRW